MEYRFEFAPRALRDADEAYCWILETSKSRTVADRWYRGLFRKIEMLKNSPHRCPIADESDAFDDEIRELLYGRRRGVYRVLFAIRGRVIHIFTIRHSARGPMEP
jgi:plasmid stabilization system protein ParE